MAVYVLAVIAIVISAFYWIFLHQPLRRRRLKAAPFPEEWQRLLQRRMALYSRLPGDVRERLHLRIKVLLDEVDFFGCAGVEVDDPMRVLIAAHGALLASGLPVGIYENLRAILIYPGSYHVEVESADGPILTQRREARLGESWEQGRVILSWEALLRESADPRATSNVALHEFAHQLDLLDGAADGAPPLRSRQAARQWHAVFNELWTQRQRHWPVDSVLDPYGGEDPAEFFAVASEAFFLKPCALKEECQPLYDCLRQFYQLDPAAWG